MLCCSLCLPLTLSFPARRKEDIMKEVKSPKKPLIYYYCIVLLIVFLFNLLVTPLMSSNQVKEVDYGTFMDMIDDKDIGTVQVEDTRSVYQQG